MCLGGGLPEVTLSPHSSRGCTVQPSHTPRIPPAETPIPLYQCLPRGHQGGWILTFPSSLQPSHSTNKGNLVSKGMLLPTTPWDTATHLCLRDNRTLLSVGSKFCPPQRMLLDTFSHTCPWIVWVPAQAVCSAHHFIKAPSHFCSNFVSHTSTASIPETQEHVLSIVNL